MRRLSTVFGTAPELRALTVRAEEILVLQRIWTSAVPAPLNRLCRVGLLQQGRLTVYTSSGALAAKLNLQKGRLLEKLQKQGVEVTSIHVEVQVETKPRISAGVQRRLSGKAARILADFAQTLPDSHLRQALQRMTKRAGYSAE
jgi:hypothetical protein